jgi:hypothetical protein
MYCGERVDRHYSCAVTIEIAGSLGESSNLQNRHSRGTDRSATSVSISETIDSRNLIARSAPEFVHELESIRDIGSILPHAVKGKILDGGPYTWRMLFDGKVHLDNGPFLNFTSSSGRKTPFSYLAAMVMDLHQS